MLKTILRKRLQVLVSVVFLSLLLTAVAAFANPITIGKEGGVVSIASGADLVIPPKSLKEDTTISAVMRKERERVTFEFGPDGTRFSKPAVLYVSWQFIANSGNIEDLTLYGEGGKKLLPKVTLGGLEYKIKHFSLYYYRRR